MTPKETAEYISKIKENSCIINLMMETMGLECPDCLYSMLSSKNVMAVLEDEELISTAQAFFENNLNIAITSEKIFMHRNTLVYRIEKIHKAIGLNIRDFDDAITLKALVILYNNLKHK